MRLKALAVFMVFIFLVLSILDAPEYVHCMDMGICEFLELQAHSVYLLKLDVMKDIFHKTESNFFNILENIVDSKEFDQGLTAPHMNIIQTFEVFSLPIIQRNLELLNRYKGYSSNLYKANLKEAALELVEISVILS